MSKVFAASLLLICASAQADQVQLSLLEKRTSERMSYSLDVKNFKLQRIASPTGSELPQTSGYSSQNRHLAKDGQVLADADEVLFQCEAGALDLVVVRDEHNAFFGPINLLAALSGHPVQVSRIVAIAVGHGHVVSERELVRKESSYHWVAKVFK